MNNTTIADCIISYIQRYPDVSTFISVLLHYIIPSVETFRWWYYNAYMEEKTQLKYHGFLTKTENRTIYYKGQIKTTMKRKPNSANSYSDALIAGLIERYGVVNDESNEVEIPDEWFYLVDTFAMQYKLQKQCEKEIREKGICNYENGARRHPLLTTLKELVASNMRIMNVLGSNPYYRERCKTQLKSNEDISAEDFISALTSSNYEGEE